MATFQKRTTRDGQVRWRVLVRLQGHPLQTATFERKSEAKDWARHIESAVRAGQRFPERAESQRTVSELLERYAAEILPNRPQRGRNALVGQLRWWIAQLGQYQLIKVKPALIADARDKLARGEGLSGRPASPATCNRYLALLSHAFSVAEKEWGWAENNPCRKVRRPSEPRGRVRFLSDEERDRLLTACRESWDSRLYLLVVLALATGARQGELLRLRWSDLDLDRGVGVLHETKNGERRALPLSPAVVELLAQRASDSRSKDDLVFSSSSGIAVFPRRPWELALETAGLENFRFHDLRHSAASYLAMKGATLAEIAEIFGHKTLAMVKRYSHLTELHTRNVVARMNERIFAGSLGGP